MKKHLFVWMTAAVLAMGCSSRTSHTPQTKEKDSVQAKKHEEKTPVYNGDRSFFSLKGKVSTLNLSIFYTPEFLGSDSEGIYRNVKGINVIFDPNGYIKQIGMGDSLCFQFSPTDKKGEFSINPIPEIRNGCTPTTVIHQMEYNSYQLCMQSMFYDIDGNAQTNNCIEWECVEDKKGRISSMSTNLFTDLFPVYDSNYMQWFAEYDTDVSLYPERIQIRMAYGGDDIFYNFYARYVQTDQAKNWLKAEYTDVATGKLAFNIMREISYY